MLNFPNRPRESLPVVAAVDLQKCSFVSSRGVHPAPSEISRDASLESKAARDHPGLISTQSESRYRSAMSALNLKVAAGQVARLAVLAAGTTAALPYAISVLPVQVSLPILAVLSLRIAKREGLFDWRAEPAVGGEGALPGDEESVKKVRRIAESIALEAGVQVPQITLNEKPNAWMWDRLLFRDVLLMGRPIIDQLDDEQLRGVVAHEIAHCNRSHTKLESMSRILRDLSVDSVTFGAFSAMGVAIGQWPGSVVATSLGVIAGAVVGLGYSGIVRGISAYISRLNELKTDLRSAHLLGGNAVPLIRALEHLQPVLLEKIHPEQYGPSWFSLHPSTSQRRAMLESVFGRSDKG